MCSQSGCGCVLLDSCFLDELTFSFAFSGHKCFFSLVIFYSQMHFVLFSSMMRWLGKSLLIFFWVLSNRKNKKIFALHSVLKIFQEDGAIRGRQSIRYAKTVFQSQKAIYIHIHRDSSITQTFQLWCFASLLFFSSTSNERNKKIYF